MNRILVARACALAFLAASVSAATHAGEVDSGADVIVSAPANYVPGSNEKINGQRIKLLDIYSVNADGLKRPMRDVLDDVYRTARALRLGTPVVTAAQDSHTNRRRSLQNLGLAFDLRCNPGFAPPSACRAWADKLSASIGPNYSVTFEDVGPNAMSHLRVEYSPPHATISSPSRDSAGSAYIEQAWADGKLDASEKRQIALIDQNSNLTLADAISSMTFEPSAFGRGIYGGKIGYLEQWMRPWNPATAGEWARRYPDNPVLDPSLTALVDYDGDGHLDRAQIYTNGRQTAVILHRARREPLVIFKADGIAAGAQITAAKNRILLSIPDVSPIVLFSSKKRPAVAYLGA